MVRVSGVESPIVELLGMKRPFYALNAMDIDDVCDMVIEAIP